MICAGMGGPLMIKILQEGREKALAMKELILQPQSEISQFREYLRTSGYHIIKEDMVFEDGKYYPMMKVIPESIVPEQDNLRQQLEDKFGPCLLEQKHPVLMQYLKYSANVTEVLISKLKDRNGERALTRLPELEEELFLIRQALKILIRT